VAFIRPQAAASAALARVPVGEGSCRKRKNEPEGAQIALRARAEKTMSLE